MKLVFNKTKHQKTSQCYLRFYSAKHVPTISYKQNKNRGIVLVQTGQQVEHLQSCIMTSPRALANTRELAKCATRVQTKTFYHLQIQFTQMLRAQRKDEGKDQYDLSIRQHPLSFSIVLQQHWKASFNDRRNEALAAVLKQNALTFTKRLLQPSERFELISQLHKKWT